MTLGSKVSTYLLRAPTNRVVGGVEMENIFFTTKFYVDAAIEVINED